LVKLVVKLCRDYFISSNRKLQSTIARRTGQQVSIRTLRRAKKKGGCLSRVRPRWPQKLTKEQAAKRLIFALKHKHWDAEDWANVVFGDGTPCREEQLKFQIVAPGEEP
jgi:hypothetical protein